MKFIVFDTEIKHGVATEDNPAQEGFKYAAGWHDFAGMGISTICAYDNHQNRTRVFMDDNYGHFEDLMLSREMIVSFNGLRFDIPLLEANEIIVPYIKHIDLAAEIWRAAGIPYGEHPKGLSLDKITRANSLPGKTGNGANAPQDYQAGNIGRIIDYCLADVRATTALFWHILTHKGITDPRNGQWLPVELPL